MYFSKQCPLCGKITTIKLNTKDSINFLLNQDTKLIQDIFPDAHIAVREVLLSGYCLKCQNLLFGSSFTETEIDAFVELLNEV